MSQPPNWYYDESDVRRAVDEGRHREAIGGLWDEMGEHQFAFLLRQGMQPQHRLLDIGAGSGRLAVKAARYLDPGNYYGTDISQALLDAARRELEAIGADDRVGVHALHATATFEIPPSMPPFDYGIAQSVFTHLRLDDFAQCLRRSRPWFQSGRLFATFFVTPDEEAQELRHEIGGVTTFSFKDPYHYTVPAILAVVQREGWSANWIGDWQHPRDQQMCELRPA